MAKGKGFALPDMGGASVSEEMMGAVPSPAVPPSASAPVVVVADDPVKSFMDLAASLPDPASLAAPEEAGPLDEAAMASLEQLESAIDTVTKAAKASAWVVGKALAGIRAGKLYRKTHGTFEAYAEERFGISRPHAYRLMDGWELALAAAPAGALPPGERHVRTLLKAARRLGNEGAATLYQAAEEAAAESGKVLTSAMLEAAVTALPVELPAVADQAAKVLRETAASAVRFLAAAPSSAAVDAAPAPSPPAAIPGARAAEADGQAVSPEIPPEFARELRDLAGELGPDGLGAAVALALEEEARQAFLSGFSRAGSAVG